MAALTIRDLDDALKQSLPIRAAHRNHSLEEEARQILRAALAPVVQEPANDVAQRIRGHFAGFGDVVLCIAPREPVRPAPEFAEPVPASPRRR